jgi:serine/threonine protein kinase
MLADFGQAFRPKYDESKGRHCAIPLQFQAPEAFFQPNRNLSYPSDIWSLACAIWEVLGFEVLFTHGSGHQDNVVSDHLDTLSQDSLPQSWREDWERQDTSEDESSFDDGAPLPRRWRRRTLRANLSLEEKFEDYIQKRRVEFQSAKFETDEQIAILALLRGMLTFDPAQRWDIERVLASEWVVRWALPSLQSQD